MSDTHKDGATPPNRGRTDHESMRRASELPLEGAPGTDTLAASGGLELPGRTGEGQTTGQQAEREDAERVSAPTAASIDKLDREGRKEK